MALWNSSAGYYDLSSYCCLYSQGFTKKTYYCTSIYRSNNQHKFHLPATEVSFPLNMILPKLIQSNLKTLMIGKRIKYYSQLDSTNQKACELIAHNEGTHGTLVVTDNQRLGKGRRNNNWFMGTGKGVAVSLILDNPLSKEDTLFLPLITGIATVKSLCSHKIVSKLKWPNDLMTVSYTHLPLPPNREV